MIRSFQKVTNSQVIQGRLAWIRGIVLPVVSASAASQQRQPDE
jgi:hypothetical protein